VAKRLHFVVERDTAQTVLRVDGEINIDSSPDLRDQLLGLVADGCPRLVVDLTGVTYIASSGLATLVEAQQRTRETGTAMVLRGVSPRIRKVFTLARLEKVFTFDGEQTD
jgi:anti-sigma B factor antagonist